LQKSLPKKIGHVHEDSVKPIFNDFVKENTGPSFDLTSLLDGRYYVHIIGDEVGGIFELNLKTES
jgi:hypothetical protein